MTQRLLQQDAILAALAGGATVVTAGERLTRAVQWAYAEAQQGAGRRAWERPLVMSWPAFLAQLWSVHEEGGKVGAAAPGGFPRLLSAIQAESLWVSVVRASGAASDLLQPRAAAQAAQEAWALCHAYRLDPAEFAKSGSADAEQFSAWASAYRERCRREQWLDAARLPEQLASWARAGALPVPARVVFAGFHEWPPQLEDFLQALRAAGSAAERLVTDIAPAENARRVACADSQQELRTAARWAAALLERNPALHIGIVVHDLAACGVQLRRELDDALCPSARLGAELERPYNLSLGGALAGVPVIHDALLLLRILVHARPDFPALSQLLRSPFVRAAESEHSARLRLELRLREAGERTSLHALAARTEDGLQELTTALTAVLDWKQAHDERLLPAAWARSFADVLRLWGWPGERTHDSVEHQALDALRGILGELARLDVLAETQDMDGALAQLSRLAAQEIFQPATPDTPVQVLGVLEATSLHFDHLWIAGWSDDAWPASPRPHALIPVSVQRQHDMPHAGARREFEFATRLTAHLLAAAPDVVVSVSQRDADRELRPSPLINALPEIGPNQLQVPQRALSGYAQLLHAAAPLLETLDDSLGPALDSGQVRGGTNVLKSQAACAFQAFARYRLGADPPLRTPSPGLDAAERGSLLHRVLYRLYGELTDQAAILGKDDAALAAVIQRAVAAVLREARGAAPEIFTPRFQALEQQRLSQLIRDWLPQERERANFSVAGRELKRTVQIGPLQLHTRVDRIDRLTDDSYAIIDYKTGDAKPAAWQGERPDEPQLPCYAVTAAEDVAAVLFAVLRPGDTEYRGYARASDTAPKVTGFDELKNPPDDCANWPALLNHWRTVLVRLAADFAAGAAKVAPKDRNRTCRVCHLANLCRIDEIQALGEPDDD